MDYIVLDFEWNQSSPPEKERKKLPFEIIEIGAVKLNSQKEIIDQFSELIHPFIYHKMHKITKKLVQLSMEDLEDGEFFLCAARNFLNWCGDDVMFCSWGDADLSEFQRNMAFYSMPPISDRPFPFLDVQKLFSISYENGKMHRSLEHAVDFLKIQKDRPFHRAYNDAYYTAKIFMQLDRSVEKYISFDLFHKPSCRKAEIHAVFDNYTKYISRKFPNKEQALMDREVCSTRCFYCRRNIRQKIKWFSVNSKNYYSISYCETHGYLKGKIHFQKDPLDNKIFVVKTTKFVSSEEVRKIKERQEKTREIRKKKRHRPKSG